VSKRPKRPRHILVADDGSKYAARASALAVALAKATGARLTAVVVREPVETRETARRRLDATLAAAAAARVRCTGLVEPPVGITNPGRRIVAAATRRRADLIVVGARGRGLVRKLLGSVSSYVVARARVSVCVVR
jgi:uncharacterized protein